MLYYEEIDRKIDNIDRQVHRQIDINEKRGELCNYEICDMYYAHSLKNRKTQLSNMSINR